MRRSSLRAVTAIFAVALLAAACSGHGSNQATSAPPRASLLPSSPSALPTFDRTSFSDLLRQLRGRVVVVNVWASWCGPCIAEAPTIASVARRFAGKVQFVGVDSQDQLGPAKAFIARYRLPFPSVFDPQASVMNALGFLAQPVTQIYRPDGSTDRQGFWASVLPQREIVAELNRLLTLS